MNNTESTNRERALQLWTSFRDEVMYNHRFYPSHPVLDKLAVFAKQNELTVKPGEIYYRTRIIDDNALAEHMIGICYGLGKTEITAQDGAMVCQPRQRPERRSSMEKHPAWVKALFTGSYFGLSDCVLRFANLSPLQTEPLW